jgi:Putative Ig domain
MAITFGGATGATAPVIYDDDNSQQLGGVCSGIGLGHDKNDGDELSTANKYIGGADNVLKVEKSTGGALTAFTFTPAAGALSGTHSQAFSQAFTKAGKYFTPVAWTTTGDDLPDGITISATTGTISGTLGAGTAGEYTFQVVATGADGATRSQEYVLTVS